MNFKSSRVLIAVALAMTSVASVDARPPSQTHCSARERVIYSCSFSRKVVSVCATQNQISYRYGSLGSPEIQITSNGRDELVHVGTVVGGGGGQETNLRFTRGPHQYMVHSAIFGSLTEVPGKTFSGVVVMRGADREAKTVAELVCRQGGPSQKGLQTEVPPFVPQEPDDRWDAWY